MASGDATAIPIKNQAYRVTFPIWDNDGDLVTGAASLDSEVSKDGGTFTDVTAEATEIATSSGMYYLDLTATEMNADTVAIIVKTTSTDAKTTPIVLYPAEDADIVVNVQQWNGVSLATTNPLPNAAAGAAGGLPTDSTGKTSFNDVSTADVNAQCDASIETYNLDHLAGADAPAAPTAGSWLGDLIEDDGGTWRFNSNTLEEVWQVATRAITDKAGFSLAADQSGVTIGTVNALAAASITASVIATAAIDADAIAADAIGASEFAQAAADKVWDTVARTLTASTNFNDISTADVNAQVSDVLKTDTIAEQAQGIPPTTPTFEEAVMYLYMALTKSVDVDSALKEFYNNAGTVIWKKALSDDGSNYVEAKGASGP